MWIPLAIYKSSCTIDVRFFPFDQQECEMKFGSWTFSASEVKMAFLDNRQLCDLSNYVFSGTWDLIGCPAKIGLGSNQKYSEISYTIILRRKTLFFTVNLLTPCIMISFLSVLTFYLPANAQEKVTLCISILLALIVFLLLVSRSLPPTSVTIPLISKYLFFAFIMNIITIVTSVMVININYCSPRTYKMPRWMRVIFLNWLPIIMFMKRPKHNQKYQRWRQRKLEAEIANSKFRHPIKRQGSSSHIRDLSASDSKFVQDIIKNEGVSSHHSSIGAADWSTRSTGSTYDTLLSPKARKAIESVSYITQHIRIKDDYDEVGGNPLQLYYYFI